MALRDKFVCGLSDAKCQRDLLCDAMLTAETALKKVRVLEVALKETEGMQAVKEPGNATTSYDCSNQCRRKYHHGVLLMLRVWPRALVCKIQNNQMSCLPEDRAYCKSLMPKEYVRGYKEDLSTEKQQRTRCTYLHDQNQVNSSVSSTEEIYTQCFNLGTPVINLVS